MILCIKNKMKWKNEQWGLERKLMRARLYYAEAG
ncbi:MAG: hypothetical protein ACJAT4_001034 [Granulosicoccus sp.]